MTDIKNPNNSLNENIEKIKYLGQSEILKAVYSNVALIQHTNNEFMIDFILKFGTVNQLVSRVILSPDHMKALSNAIIDNIEKYNKKHRENIDGSNYDSY